MLLLSVKIKQHIHTRSKWPSMQHRNLFVHYFSYYKNLKNSLANCDVELAKISTPNLFIGCCTSGKSTKQLTGKYFDKIRESISSAASILVLGKQSGSTDEGVCIQKCNFNVEPVFLPPGMTKYLQPLDVQFFKATSTRSKKQWNIPKLITAFAVILPLLPGKP